MCATVASLVYESHKLYEKCKHIGKNLPINLLSLADLNLSMFAFPPFNSLIQLTSMEGMCLISIQMILHCLTSSQINGQPT